MGVQLKSADEIRLMRKAGVTCASILDEVCAMAAPGVSTLELDKLARRLMDKHKVKSAFLGYYGYPAVLCTSINHVIVHGIPSKADVLAEGDIIGIDCGIFEQGFCADTARTITIGKVAPEAQAILDAARDSLELAIATCVVGARIGDIGSTVQKHAESKGFSVVRKFVGHGVGRAMHEDPQVANFGRAGEGKRLKHGLVIAVEPMVNAGSPDVEVLDDDWTAITTDRRLSAHFEHTIAVLDEGPWVLTRASSTRPGDLGTP